MDAIKNIVICGLLAGFLTTLLIAGIDREIARQDYLAGRNIENCMFDFNCEYYDLLEGQNQ